MKEELRQLWNQPEKAAAKAFLASWTARAKASGIAILIRLSNTLLAPKAAYWPIMITRSQPAPLEGTNNKIKTLQKQVYGFRDMDFFKRKIMALQAAMYALVG